MKKKKRINQACSEGIWWSYFTQRNTYSIRFLPPEISPVWCVFDPRPCEGRRRTVLFYVSFVFTPTVNLLSFWLSFISETWDRSVFHFYSPVPPDINWGMLWGEPVWMGWLLLVDTNTTFEHCTHKAALILWPVRVPFQVTVRVIVVGVGLTLFKNRRKKASTSHL